ncbi:serine hydrolase domain-containing protein [Acidobacterium sp. S8]|uniref:serine hydrolase domain-containing protein n=1 Tax=Acidobacterium sp. S8 TaxID=1641854 RepID=UPI00131DED81|nr:serine hydrolase domain-containing protein [Acidobacterium sp. S8]
MPLSRVAVRLLAIFAVFSGTVRPLQIPVTPTAPQPAHRAAETTPPTVPGNEHALEAADLEAFFDGILPLQLERNDIAGASVLVMQNGNVLLKKGYGYADEKTNKPVNPDTTIFRLASISKLFTWVSVMQLEEQGKLDLDTDINHYLDFQIAPAFGKPIALRNLMTHTGGFEEESNDIIFTDPKKVVSLRDFLIQNQPKRLFPPGTVPAYSNYGVGLASYIVQRVSGMPFEQYVQDHVFAPLGMTHSTFYQPPPKALASSPSEGYRDDTQKPPVGFEIFNPVGAGGLSSTAADMGRFGTALLQGGELDGQRILKPETLAAMWTPQFRASDQMPPIAMGFYETWRNHLRWIGHEGDLIAFHSLFFVEPTEKLVLFVSYNSAGGGDSKPRPEIINMFTDRYFPGDMKQSFVSLSRQELDAIKGRYQSTRRADSTHLALANLFDQHSADVNKAGILHVEDFKDLRDHAIKWKPIGNDLWQEVDGQRRLFAIRDSSGKVIRLAYDFPGVQAQRVPWYENSHFVLSADGCSLAVLACVILASLSRTARRIFLKRPRPSPQPGTRWLPFVTQAAAWVWVTMLVSILTFFAMRGDHLMPPTPAWDKYMLLIDVVTAFAMLLSFFAILSGIRIWRRPETRHITRLKYSLVALACVFLCWFAIHWNLLGPVHRI